MTSQLKAEKSYLLVLNHKLNLYLKKELAKLESRDGTIERDLLRVQLMGRVAPEMRYREIELDDVEIFYHHIENQTIPDYDLEELAASGTTKGRFVSILLEKLAQTQETDEREIILNALYCGLDAFENNPLEYREIKADIKL